VALGGRAIVLLALALYLGSVIIGGRTQWRRLHVPAETPTFLDLRSVTTAWECQRRGIDPLPHNPCDPRGRPANYPRLWLLPGRLGLGERVTVPLGVVIAIVFLLSALWFLGPLKMWEGLIAAAVLCSPAVMFGVERGNVDILIFAIVVAALSLFRSPDSARRATSHVLFLLAAVLKIFPAFSFAALVRQRRPWLFVAGGVALLFAIDVLVTLDDLRTIRRVLPQEVRFSYGAGIFADAIADSLTTHTGWPGTGRSVTRALLVVVVVAGLAVAAALAWWWSRSRPSAPSRWSGELDGFWVGAAIYVGTYAFLRNYDYRLVFLILALPQLMRWASDLRPAVPAARWALVVLVAALWLAAREPTRFPFEEGLNWILFVYLVAALVATSPRPSFEARAS
jgi:drug/metabolite transporter superfamily protein YnfA